MSDDNSTILDLDALVPQPRYVKLGEQKIEIKPPKTADILKIGALGQKLEKSAELGDGELERTLDQLTAQVKVCVPELKDVELNTAQLLKLVELISEMAMPPDAEELKKRGIEADTPKKVQ